MKNPKLFFALSCILLSSCVKQDDDHDQMFHVYYYEHTDSFKVEGMLSGDKGPLLDKKETLTFNGQAPGENDGVVYYWRGKGKPEGTVILKQRKHEYVNSIPRGTIGDVDFTCPDTVSKSQGFTIRLQNYRPESQPGLLLNSDQPDWFYAGIAGDSAFISPEHLANVHQNEMYITLSELGGGTFGNVATGKQGGWVYRSEHTKSVVIIP